MSLLFIAYPFSTRRRAQDNANDRFFVPVVPGSNKAHSQPWMLQQDSGSRRVMAAMVSLIPSADTAQVYVITLMTYLIAVGGFMHIVPGSMEAFMLTVGGDTTWTYVTIHFGLPVLAGNIIG